MQRLKRKIYDRLQAVYTRDELKFVTIELLRYLPGLSENCYYTLPELPPSAERDRVLDDWLARLSAGEPLQYVVGHADFCSLKLKCDRRALIPRPETTELVGWIEEQETSRTAAFLDIGTGSGCIAIALARKRPEWNVTAWDISGDALSLAMENSIECGVRIEFERHDILNWQNEVPGRKYDIIASNPPYIASHERENMKRNVLEYEPHSALFVPDDDPLRFYRAIAGFGLSCLNEGGAIYFEINPLYADDMEAMLNGMGYAVTFRNDISGRRRMARIYLNHE